MNYQYLQICSLLSIGLLLTKIPEMHTKPVTNSISEHKAETNLTNGTNSPFRLFGSQHKHNDTTDKSHEITNLIENTAKTQSANVSKTKSNITTTHITRQADSLELHITQGVYFDNPFDQLKEPANRIFKDELFTHARIPIDSYPIANFDPTDIGLSTVCEGGSTIPHGNHKVMRWLRRFIYKMDKSRPFFAELRRSLYESAAEQCHTTKYIGWIDYHFCAMFRSQRLEKMIPYYPVHQKSIN